MLKNSLVFLSLLAAYTLCFAQEKKEDWPVGSAVRTLIEAAEKLSQLDIEVDFWNKKLVDLIVTKKINSDLRLPRAVSDENDGWKKFRSVDCYLGSAINGGGGAWPEANAIECEIVLTNVRLQLIRSTTSCVEKIETTQVFEGASCLRALQSYSTEQR